MLTGGKKSGSSTTGYPQQILGYLSNIIFPISCVGCGRFPAGNKPEYICKSCLSAIPPKNSFECIGCKKISPFGNTCIECPDFKAVDQLLIVSDYKNPLLEKTIKTLKYRLIPDIAESFRPLLKKYIIRLSKYKNFNITADNPLIIPIPLHPRRLNWRGFNQAELIAGIVADITQLKVRNNILLRSRNSKPQVELEKREERLKNMAQKFTISQNNIAIKDRVILLVDDVCTTGATLNEAAKILKENGVSKVISFVIAR